MANKSVHLIAEKVGSEVTPAFDGAHYELDVTNFCQALIMR